MAANNIYIQVAFNSQSAQQNVNALNQAIASTGPTAAKSSQQATAGLTSVSVSVQQVSREFSQLTAAIAGLGISRAIGALVQMSAELSRTKLAMESFTGSAEAANKVFEQIRAIAATGPFRFKDLEETGQRLLGFGMAAKNVPDTLKVIADQVARMGGSIEGVNTIVTVFGRVMEKNFVGAMDVMRALPAQGIPALKALGDEMSKELGRAVDVEEVRAALKQGILDPLQFIRVQLDAMRQKGDAGKFSDDAARAFKNLGDAVDNALGKLFGPDGFGPALTKLGNEIGEALTPIGGLIDKLMKLPEPDKEMILNWAAAAAAIAAFGTALAVVTNLVSPLAALTAGLVKFTASLVLMNPELALTALVLGGIGAALYKMVPQIQDFVDKGVKAIRDKLTGFIAPLQEEGKKFFAAIFGGGEAIEPGALINTDALFATLKEQEQKHAAEASHTLLEALGSPAEAVHVKYVELFAELEEKMKSFKDEAQKTALRGILGGAESSELAAAQLKDNKKQIDELARYNQEKVKGSYDAQIAYIEAMDARDLNSKVAAIDKVTDLRIASAQEVAKVQDDALQQSFEATRKLLEDHRVELEALGADVTKAIATQQNELRGKQAVINEKAADDEQKYRLEGWKKANDAIIEDQKRVFDAFKSEFDQLFDAFTSKSPGRAIANVFKSMALGEAKNLFSSTAASAATAAAGYGVPAQEITKGGILGQLMQRGMPVRPPGAPPDIYTPAAPHSSVSFDGEGGANRFASSTNTYEAATLRFAVAVSNFAGAVVSTKGGADRMADDGGGATATEAAMLGEIRRRESSGNYGAQNTKSSASGAYQFTNSTWRMARQATGIGGQYGTAKEAPQSVQDANALWLLRKYGPNSSTSWEASGPYGVGTGGADQGGADFSTTVYASADGGGGYSPALPGYQGGFTSVPHDGGAAAAALGVLGHMAGGGGFNVGQATSTATKLLAGWKGMLGFGAVHGATPGSESLARAAEGPGVTPGGAFSWSGLANSPLAKAAAGLGGGMLAQRGLLGPAMGTGAGILEGTLGGAGVGFSIGGPLGAGIGAAVGLGIGAGEMLAGVESPRNQAKRLANQLYHIAINNTTADQIVALANSSYGGSVSRAMRAPEVRHMLGLFAAGTGQSFAQGFNDPHGASLVESGGRLQQQQTYQYGQGYVQSSGLPTYGGGSPSVLGAPGGLSLSLNIGGQDAAKFMTGQVVTPDVVQTQYAAAMNGSSGRVAQALMMSEPGSIAT